VTFLVEIVSVVTALLVEFLVVGLVTTATVVELLATTASVVVVAEFVVGASVVAAVVVGAVAALVDTWKRNNVRLKFISKEITFLRINLLWEQHNFIILKYENISLDKALYLLIIIIYLY
jgi:hypothetical protein